MHVVVGIILRCSTQDRHSLKLTDIHWLSLMSTVIACTQKLFSVTFILASPHFTPRCPTVFYATRHHFGMPCCRHRLLPHTHTHQDKTANPEPEHVIMSLNLLRRFHTSQQ